MLHLPDLWPSSGSSLEECDVEFDGRDFGIAACPGGGGGKYVRHLFLSLALACVESIIKEEKSLSSKICAHVLENSALPPAFPMIVGINRERRGKAKQEECHCCRSQW
jgi:hypothetical protein